MKWIKVTEKCRYFSGTAHHKQITDDILFIVTKMKGSLSQEKLLKQVTEKIVKSSALWLVFALSYSRYGFYNRTGEKGEN